MTVSRSLPLSLRPSVQRVLRKTFGLRRLRPGQEEVIAHVMAGRDTLAVMPTGAGKSLCYQLPALLLAGRTVVVSPLIALMKDQCDGLNAMGVPAVQLNSAMNSSSTQYAMDQVSSGQARIVFVTPERLADPAFRAALAEAPTSLLTIDEAHCISQWGHDFRPSFLEIGATLASLGRPTLLALTATAGDEVVQDIVRQLDVGEFAMVRTGAYRPNLWLGVEQVANEAEKRSRMLAAVAERPGPTIVYAATIKAVEEVTEALRAAGERVGCYHGRLPMSQRRAAQEAFMEGTVRVMVATNAFGLGIDKPDVRGVVHYQMPGGLDAYYQEIGRAGRDGESSRCLLLHLRKDRAVQQFFLVGRYPEFDDVEQTWRTLLSESPDGRWTVRSLEAALARPRAKVRVALQLLRRHRIVGEQAGVLSVHRTDLDGPVIEQLLLAYRDKRERDHALLEQMVAYDQSGRCRWKVLLDHLGEGEGFAPCDHCDNCSRRQAHEAVLEAAAQADVELAVESAEGKERQTIAAPSFARGQVVSVRRYGRGLVVDADAQSVTVQFPQGETRCFLSAFVQAAAGPRPRRGAREGFSAASG